MTLYVWCPREDSNLQRPRPQRGVFTNFTTWAYFGAEGESRTHRTQILSLICIPIPSQPHIGLRGWIRTTNSTILKVLRTSKGLEPFAPTAVGLSTVSALADYVVPLLRFELRELLLLRESTLPICP